MSVVAVGVVPVKLSVVHIVTIFLRVVVVVVVGAAVDVVVVVVMVGVEVKVRTPTRSFGSSCHRSLPLPRANLCAMADLIELERICDLALRNLLAANGRLAECVQLEQSAYDKYHAASMERDWLETCRTTVEEERTAASAVVKNLGLYQHAEAAKTGARLQQMFRAWEFRDAQAPCIAAVLTSEQEPG